LDQVQQERPDLILDARRPRAVLRGGLVFKAHRRVYLAFKAHRLVFKARRLGSYLRLIDFFAPCGSGVAGASGSCP